MFCPNCGTRLDREYIFCPNCGQKLHHPAARADHGKILSYAASTNDWLDTLRNAGSSFRDSIGRTAKKDMGMAQQSLLPIPHIHGLEDESETKIGSFERILHAMLNKEPNTLGNISVLGYDDKDFAPLVNLLSGVVEIEFNSVFFNLLKRNGIDTERRDCAMFGELYTVYKHNKILPVIARVVSDISVSKSQFVAIHKIRNRANHKEIIEVHDFMNFYNNYFLPFFSDTIAGIVTLKENGTAAVSKTERNTPKLSADKDYCVLMTNSDILALKYFGKTCERDSSTGNVIRLGKVLIIERIIAPFIEKASELGKVYLLLDIPSENGKCLSWEKHLKILDDFRKKHPKIKRGSGLFIIGGDDVVPMPRLRNPFSIDSQNPELHLLENLLESDWPYSFPASDIELDSKGYLRIDRLLAVSPVFSVGRLPLEDGLMESDIDSDIGNYLRRDIANHIEPAKLNNLTTVACQSAQKVANKMVEGIPIASAPSLLKPNYVSGNVFISPLLSLDKNSPHHVSKYAEEKYVNQIYNSDSICLLLHGTPQPATPGFLGESLTPPQSEYTTAFIPQMFANSKAKVILPICCWGARFIGYRRDNSSLLTAIYNNALVYMGSCRSAVGSFDYCFKEGQAVGISCSEILMRNFMQHLFSGKKSGLSLQLAKSEYLNACQNLKPHDIMTVLQFNLFGDPMIRLARCITPAAQASTKNEKAYSYSPEVVSHRDNTHSGSILNRVRSLVDSNIEDIQRRINSILYNEYGLTKSVLHRVEKYSLQSGEEYLFSYMGATATDAPIYVRADMSGNILEIIGSM